MQPPWALKWVGKSNEGRGTLSMSYLFLAVWPLCQHSRRDPLKKCPRNNQFWKSFKIQHHFPLCPSTFPSRGESLIPCPCRTGKNRTHRGAVLILFPHSGRAGTVTAFPSGQGHLEICATSETSQQEPAAVLEACTEF